MKIKKYGPEWGQDKGTSAMRRHSILTGIIALGCLFFLAANIQAGESIEIPVKNTVTLVDLGANTCIPCKMMAPILEELKKEYEGKAAVIFIDAWKEPERGKEFKVSTIPTQIFFDKTGKETFRHVGFFDKQSIKEILDRMVAEK